MGELYYSEPELRYDEKRGTYRARVYHMADGKRKYKCTTLKATGKRQAKAEMNAWHNALEQEIAERIRRGDTGLSIAETLVPDYVGQYIDQRAKDKSIESSTIKSYRTSLKYIAAAFSSTQIKALSNNDIQQWIANLVKAGYSSSTITKPYRLLRMVLDVAVKERAISENPTNDVKTPKRQPKKEGINALSRADRLKLIKQLEALELSPTVVAAYIALNTGMRREEVCGLQWCDIKEDRESIFIERAIGLGDGSAYVKNTKNDQSREVPLSDDLARVLKRWKEQQRIYFADNLSSLKSSSYILGSPLGYYHPDRLTKDWKALATVLGAKGETGEQCTFHDLRHTFATLWVADSGDPKIGAAILGHDVIVFMKTYCSINQETKRLAKTRIDNLNSTSTL